MAFPGWWAIANGMSGVDEEAAKEAYNAGWEAATLVERERCAKLAEQQKWEFQWFGHRDESGEDIYEPCLNATLYALTQSIRRG